MYEPGGRDTYEVPRGLREVIPNQTGYCAYREFTVHTGGVISTLQDIKLPDTAGGYTYSNPDWSPLLANRTIYWRTMGDVLELSEVSLNFNLLRNRVFYKFQDSPLLDGVSVHESWGHVMILVPTVSSVHRLSFPHPTRMVSNDKQFSSKHDEDGVMSIFSEASIHTAREYEHQLSFPSTSPLPHLATSYYTAEEDSVFVYCNSQSQLTCVKMGQIRGMASVTQLSSPSSYLLGRVWTSLTSRSNENRDQPLSIVMTTVGGVLMLLAICKDHKLRVWKLDSGDCVSCYDVGQFVSDGGKEMIQGSQHHQLSIVKQDTKGNDSTLVCAYLCFQQQAQFINLSLSYTAGQLDIKPKDTIYCPEYDLVGYSATSGGIASCWTNSEGETIVCRRVKGGGAGWENVSLMDTESSPDLEDDQDTDPRELYLGALFAPGVFRAATLAKTIGIFRRNLDIVDEFTSWDQLKIEVVSAVEAEIQNNLSDYELSDEDYFNISREAWSSFYSCATQYRATGLQPMGLVTSPGENTILIIRKDILTWCRPVEALEQVVISEGSGSLTAQIFSDVPPLSDAPALAQDVLNLLLASGKVGAMLSGSTLKSFRDDVYQQQAPDVVSRRLAAKILADQQNPAAIDQILCRIQQVHDLPRAMEAVLYCLELDTGSISKGELDLEKLYSDQPMPKVYASELGISLVAESLRQQVESRLNLSQQLLVMQYILRDCGAKARLSPSVLDAVLSTFLPRTTVMVHCYTVLSWLSQVPVSRPPSCIEDMNVRQLAVLRIQDKLGAVTYSNNEKNTSLLELFMKGPGRVVRLAVGEANGDDCWTRSLPPLINMTAQLLWPRCASSIFLKFLFRSCQHVVVQNYCRLLSTWCEWHPYVRQFLMASSLLNMGEEEKALDLFINAAAGVPQDGFLAEDILELNGSSPDDLVVQYFLKVISLLEQFPCTHLVINLAQTAIAMCPEGHKEKPTLSYILFSYHLKLGHNEDAYAAMMSNPEASRRKDSLRQFLVTLFDRGELSELAGYHYTDMIDEVESIIESRARSADLSVNNYYDFLYSFHVTRQNFRKAAQVMFECGYRLGVELCNLDGLKKQVQSYLSCINCLHLVNKKYQWLIKKLPSASIAMSPKRCHDGEEKEAMQSLGFEVVELEDIRKQLVLSQARLKLTLTANANTDGNLPVSPGLTPSETVGFLTTANLYLLAIQICEEFKLQDIVRVAEALATKAVRLSTAKSSEKAAAWQWLAENRPAGTDVHSECAVTATWTLLKHVVENKEAARETVVHRVVTTRLFTLGVDLPPWLVAGYKKRDAAELIRLYHAQGKLEAAVDLAVEYLEAVMGQGSEYFGLESSLMANKSPSWVPWTVLDRLFLELADNVAVPSFASALKRLEGCVDKYLNTVDRVSRDIIANRA